MVSSYIISDGVSWNNKNPILVTCDSIGGLSIINANKMNVVAQYETFMADSDDTASTITNVGGTLSQLLQLLPLPSSSKNNPCNIGTLKYTKGTRANVDIATCLHSLRRLLHRSEQHPTWLEDMNVEHVL
jgi:hypothetical protein